MNQQRDLACFDHPLHLVRIARRIDFAPQVPEGMQEDEVDSDVYGTTTDFFSLLFAELSTVTLLPEPPPPANDLAEKALEGAGAIAAAALLKIQSSSTYRKVVALGLHLSPGNVSAVLKKLSGRISELEVPDR